MQVHGSFWFIFHSILIMYSAIYVLFMTREVHIFTLKLSFRNMNHTCSIRFDTLIMKRYFLVFHNDMCSIFITIDYGITFTYVCTCILYIYSRWMTIYALVCDTNNCIYMCKHVEDVFTILKNVRAEIFGIGFIRGHLFFQLGMWNVRCSGLF